MPLIEDNDFGKKHGKYDMERIGLFAEMPYMIGDKYQRPNQSNNIRDLKKSQMYPDILKTKTGLQDAYFDKEYKRLFENENSQFNKSDRNNKQKFKPFIPSSKTKKHSTPGDEFGTFGPKLPAMSRVTKEKPLQKKNKYIPNMLTNATNTRGPGYGDIGLSPYPEYKSSPYDNNPKKTERSNKDRKIPFILCSRGEYFNKNPYFNEDIMPIYKKTYKDKFKGTPFKPSSAINRVGNGFDDWPVHKADRYVDAYRIGYNDKKEKKDFQKYVFYPQTRNKSLYTTSTMDRKLKISMNNTNWESFVPIHVPVIRN